MARRNDGTGCGVLLIGVIALAFLGRCSSSPTDPSPAVAQAPPAAVTTTKYIDTASLNCRAEPDRKAARVASYDRGQSVRVSATEGDWSKVERVIGDACWVSSKYLSDELRAAPTAPARALLDTSSDFSPEPRRKRRPSGSGYSCGGKRYCREMNSCAEAYHYLNQCGVYRLDGDSDGVPCESLC